jgi:hypothetical protein
MQGLFLVRRSKEGALLNRFAKLLLSHNKMYDSELIYLDIKVSKSV